MMPRRDCSLIFLRAVPPDILNLTTSSSTVYVGERLITTCCARGYPVPIIFINGNMVPTNFGIATNGVYERCASLSTNTSNITPGTMMTTYCNVSLHKTVTCTATGQGGLPEVPPEVVDNCQAALSASVHKNTSTLIASKWSL